MLGGLEKLRICVGYKYEGTVYRDFPTGLASLDRVEPVYEDMDGWNEDIATTPAIWTNFRQRPVATWTASVTCWVWN